jgi:hypothetical protein
MQQLLSNQKSLMAISTVSLLSLNRYLVLAQQWKFLRFSFFIGTFLLETAHLRTFVGTSHYRYPRHQETEHDLNATRDHIIAKTSFAGL